MLAFCAHLDPKQCTPLWLLKLFQFDQSGTKVTTFSDDDVVDVATVGEEIIIKNMIKSGSFVYN